MMGVPNGLSSNGVGSCGGNGAYSLEESLFRALIFYQRGNPCGNPCLYSRSAEIFTQIREREGFCCRLFDALEKRSAWRDRCLSPTCKTAVSEATPPMGEIVAPGRENAAPV
jgi:hypothetical protein